MQPNSWRAQNLYADYQTGSYYYYGLSQWDL